MSNYKFVSSIRALILLLRNHHAPCPHNPCATNRSPPSICPRTPALYPPWSMRPVHGHLTGSFFREAQELIASFLHRSRPPPHTRRAKPSRSPIASSPGRLIDLPALASSPRVQGFARSCPIQSARDARNQVLRSFPVI